MDKSNELWHMIGATIVKKEETENGNSKASDDRLDGNSSYDHEQENQRKRKLYRHTPYQIQELKAFFKHCPHPDEAQKNELSKRLCLDPKQVKYWFQNHRTQLKNQLERHENSLLKLENERLRYEQITISDAIRNPTCNSCGGSKNLGRSSLEEQQLRVENARLKDELNIMRSLADKFICETATTKSSISLNDSSLELVVGSNVFGSFDIFSNNNMSGSVGTDDATPPYKPMSNFTSEVGDGIEKSTTELPLSETIKPLWTPSLLCKK